MLAPIILDGLLVLILLMMIPLGFLRGGLREICTSAGMLFGVVFAGEWASQWGDWVAGRVAIQEGAARFIVAIGTVVLSTAVIGYGGSAAFSYRPGPGGRMYGAFLALLNGIVFAGFLINSVVATVYDGDAPEAIDRSFVGRGLSSGFGWVLLLVFIGVIGATVFGMFVRERPEDDFAYVPTTATPPARRQPGPASSGVTEVEPADAAEHEARPAAPMRIREVRHWETGDDTSSQDDYGGGWGQTWPNPRKQGPALPWEQQPPPKKTSMKRDSSTRHRDRDEDVPRDRRDVVRDFVRDDDTDGTT